MRYLFFSISFIFLGLLGFGCTDKGLEDNAIYQEKILGDWDIEGGGTLFFDEEKKMNIIFSE